jgi:hypothetical protein
MWGNDSTGEAIATIEADAVAASGTVDLDLARVWRKAIGGVLGGDTALDGEAAGRDGVLGEAELLERGTCGDLDLGGDEIDAGDLLGDGVLNLAIYESVYMKSPKKGTQNDGKENDTGMIRQRRIHEGLGSDTAGVYRLAIIQE